MGTPSRDIIGKNTIDYQCPCIVGNDKTVTIFRNHEHWNHELRKFRISRFTNIETVLCYVVNIVCRQYNINVEHVISLNCNVGGHGRSKFRISRFTKVQTVLCCVCRRYKRITWTCTIFVCEPFCIQAHVAVRWNYNTVEFYSILEVVNILRMMMIMTIILIMTTTVMIGNRSDSSCNGLFWKGVTYLDTEFVFHWITHQQMH